MWRRSSRLQITSLPLRRTLLRVVMLQYSSPRPPSKKLFIQFMRTSSTLRVCSTTLSLSSFSLKTQVLAQKKSRSLTTDCKNWDSSTHLLSNSLRFWLKTKDLDLSEALLTDTKSCTSSSIGRKRSLLFLRRLSPHPNSKKFLLPSRPILTIQAKSSSSSSL